MLAQLQYIHLSLSVFIFSLAGCRTVCSVTRSSIVCQRVAAKPQMMGQLPFEHVTPGSAFDTVGLDYAGPIMIKYGYVHKPTLVKAYICVFVALTIKAGQLTL